MINFLNKIKRTTKKKQAALVIGCISIVAIIFHFSPYIIAETKFYLKNDSYYKNIELLPGAMEKTYQADAENSSENNTENTDIPEIVIEDGASKVQSEKTYNSEIQNNQSPQTKSNSYTLSIPKIGVNSAIKLNVDMFDKKAYEEALTHGVAHASGTALPGEIGNSFIFGHSSAPLGITRSYAAIEFVLLNHLDSGDEILVLNGDNKYSYKIFDKKVVSDDSMEYIHKYYGKDTITLMTCWPPGTNLKRLLVIAEKTE
jgi:sortase A